VAYIPAQSPAASLLSSPHPGRRPA
jgi:hypothetical protein